MLLKELTSVETLVRPIQRTGALSLGSMRCGLMGLLESKSGVSHQLSMGISQSFLTIVVDRLSCGAKWL